MVVDASSLHALVGSRGARSSSAAHQGAGVIGRRDRRRRAEHGRGPPAPEPRGALTRPGRHRRADAAHRRHRDRLVPAVPRLELPAPDARRGHRRPRRRRGACASCACPAWIALPVVAAGRPSSCCRSSTTATPPTCCCRPGRRSTFIRADLRLRVAPVPQRRRPGAERGQLRRWPPRRCSAPCALLADTFAFRAYGRAEAVVPAGRGVRVHLGARHRPQPGRSSSALWIGTAIVVIAVLRFSHGARRLRRGWAPAGARSASVLPATLACAAVAARRRRRARAAPARRRPAARCSNTRNSGSNTTQVLNPLVDIRSRLINRANVEVFTVQAIAGRVLAGDRPRALRRHRSGRRPSDEHAAPRRAASWPTSAAAPRSSSRSPSSASAASSCRRRSPRCRPRTDGLLFADDTQTLVVARRRPDSPGQVIQLDLGAQRPAGRPAAPGHRRARRPRQDALRPARRLPRRGPRAGRARSPPGRPTRTTRWSPCRTGSAPTSPTTCRCRPATATTRCASSCASAAATASSSSATFAAMARVARASRRAWPSASRRASCATTGSTTCTAATPTPGRRCGSTASAGSASSRRPVAASPAPRATPASRRGAGRHAPGPATARAVGVAPTSLAQRPAPTIPPFDAIRTTRP